MQFSQGWIRNNPYKERQESTDNLPLEEVLAVESCLIWVEDGILSTPDTDS